MNAKFLANLIINNPNNLEDIMILVKKYKLEALLPSIFSIIKKTIDQNKKQNSLKIETAFPLDEMAINKIVSLLKKEGVQVKTDTQFDEVIINKKLIAGFKVSSKDKIVDATLDTLLSPFYKQAL